MTPQQSHDEAIRVLGARDGLAHALIAVNLQIAYIIGPYSPRIHPRHTRKMAERERRLRPLRELQERFTEQHRACQEAYKTFSQSTA